MKKFVLTLTALSVIFNCTLFSQFTAYANQPAYGRVLTESVAFCKNPNSSEVVFYLPYSYFVKILEVGYPYTKIEVYGENDQGTTLDGFVLTSEIALDNYGIDKPYLDLTVTTATTTNLYLDSGLTKIERAIFEGRKLTYYGYLLDDFGNYIYFVKYNDQTGYVKESCITPFTVPVHEIPVITTPDEPPETPSETPSENNLEGLKIAIILCLSLAFVIICVAFFKPKKAPVLTNYYDENDYE